MRSRRRTLQAIPSLIADIVFPGRCLLCGAWLLFSGEPGSCVCAECVARLAPLEGRRCGICSIPLVSEMGICTRCRGTSYSFARNHSVFAYAAHVKELVRSYKFSGRTRLSRLFAKFLAEAVTRQFPGAPIVPVPSRPGGDGPDHIGRIAGILSREYGFAIFHLLARAPGVSQKTLDLEERRRNLLGKIRLKPACTIPERVVLLDDIFTTGATADACASVLRAGGSSEVGVITLAIEE
jgi:ComF family protein